jgi:hypothetical protein
MFLVRDMLFRWSTTSPQHDAVALVRRRRFYGEWLSRCATSFSERCLSSNVLGDANIPSISRSLTLGRLVSSRKAEKSLHFQRRSRDIGSGFPALPADLTIYRNLPRTELTKPIRFLVSSRTCLRRHCTDDPFDMLWYGTESLDRLAEFGDYRSCLDLRASRKNDVFSATDIWTSKQRRLGIRLSCLWIACLTKQRTASMSSTIARYSRLACALYSCVFGFSDRYLYRRLLLCCRSCLSMLICISGSTVSKTRKASDLTE